MQETNSILDQVKNQYEKFPYPHFSWLAGIKKSTHASYETGSQRVNKKSESHEGKKIALLGCGTNEALAFGQIHKKAEIHAVDLSQKAIQISKLRCKIRGLRNIQFHNEDILSFQKNHENTFDYIHAYGVLHHLENPQRGFEAVKKMLKPQGFARIMVYSKASRQRINHLQKVLKLMNYDFNTPQKEVKEFIKTLPWENPLRLAFEMHPEINNKSGLVDAFLHSNEQSFYIEALQNILSKTGLSIRAWDFSQNILNLLKDAMGKTTEEKISHLEAYDQWPSQFTFWISHK